VPASRVTERVFMAILRAVVDLGLASGASPRATEQRAMHAVSNQEDSWRTHRH
jgi:hypothetical protein